MTTILKLTMATLCALATISTYAADKADTQDVMVMHHMHVLINHAMEMAAGGSNLVMLGEMDMAPGVDEMTVHHGQMMIDDAKSLINEVMNGKEMAELHKKGETAETSPEMAYAHKLAKAAKAYIDLISRMPSSGGKGEHMDMNMKMDMPMH